MSNELEFNKPRDAWQALFDNLMLLAPIKLLSLLKGEEKKTKHHPLTKIVPAVIVTLSIASISNLVSRASHHHPGLPADATGTAIAVLVPIAVFAAVHSNLGIWRKLLISFIALVFAATSSFIQFQIYAPSTGFKMTSDLFEALAFGAGVPIAECLLAVIEFLLLEQDASANAAIEQAIKDEESRKILESERKAQEVAEIERQRIKDAQAIEDARVLTEQKRQESERQARIREAHDQVIFDLEIEQKRLEMQARLDAERLKLEAKLQQKSVAKSVAKDDSESVARNTNTPEVTEKKPNPATLRRNELLKLLQQYGDIGDTAFGEKLNADRTTIYRDLKAMEKTGKVHLNGNGWTVGGK